MVHGATGLARWLLAREHVFLLMVAVLIGVVGGYGAVGFRLAINQIEHVFFGSDQASLLERVEEMPKWAVFLCPAIGGLIIGPIVHFFAQESKGHGVPEVMEATVLQGGVIRPRVLPAKLLASATCIGSGGSVGREGPIVQIGSTAGSIVGQIFGVSEDRLRTLVGCGAAAGIAATFNAPIAGALFSAEVILGGFGAGTFSPIVLSSVMATVVARSWYQEAYEQPAFGLATFSLHGAEEIAFYIGLGVVAGVVGVTFTRVLYASDDLFEWLRIPGYLKPGIGGAIVGAIAIGYPQVLGLGYESIEMAMSRDTEDAPRWTLLATLLGLKILATSVTLGRGGSGGIFAPSLFIGAMTGGLAGAVINQMYPGTVGPPGAYALVGMAAVVSATTHGPITAIVIVYELTRDYQIILPLMTACVISILVARRLLGDSIYTLKLTRRGLRIARGRDVTVLESLRVRDIVSSSVDKLRAGATFDEMLEMFQRSAQSILPVVADGDRLLGIVRTDDLKRHMSDVQVGPLVVAADVMRPPPAVLYPEEDLESVLGRLAADPDEEVPVVASDDAARLVGLVSQSDLLRRYETEIRQRRIAG